jgi:predicted DNA-binding WGR domain protein
LAAARRVLWEMALRDAPMQPSEASDAVAADLTAVLCTRGYHVSHAVGQSNFRCDLAVRREDDRAYRLGILIDTDDYYEQPNVLERDVLKPKLLRAFGWHVVHVLTKDWYQDRDGVLQSLERLLAGEVVNDAEAEERDESTAPRAAKETAPIPGPGDGGPAVAAALATAPGAAAASLSRGTRYFEFIGGGSRKFWEITLAGNAYTVRFGRIGTDGQSKTKQFGDAKAAARDAERLIAEKVGKGYMEK